MAILPTSRKNTITYSDFFKDLTQSPINNDLARKTDENAVKESIKNLILTNRGERLFQPDVGCDIRSLLFDNITPDVPIVIKQMIEHTISTYEPRCNLIDVQVNAALDSNSIVITIIFSLINTSNVTSLTVALDRVR